MSGNALDELQVFLAELHASHGGGGGSVATADVEGLVEGLATLVIGADPTFTNEVFAGALSQLARVCARVSPPTCCVRGA